MTNNKAGATLPSANMLMREPEKTAGEKKCTVTRILDATEVAGYLNSEHAF